MASLHFKGKSAVWNHHLSVPYHTFEKDKKASLPGENDSENLIIEGDNLIALKALLPKYQGKVKCIYIDPPYNTGNEEWVYNDNVNNPLITSWFKGVVGKEGEDFTRHDKWLCMMAPRLKLLRDLLSENGLIFISIDENEAHNLKVLLIEIFGNENYIAEFVWKKGAGTENDNNYVATNHEYVLCFAKDKKHASIYFLPPSEQMLLTYDLEDEFVAERGKHYLRGLNDFSIGDRPGLHYDITCPDGTKLMGSEHRWRCDNDKFKKRLQEKRIVFVQSENSSWKVMYKQYSFEKKEEVIRDENDNILSYGRIPNTVIDDIASTGDAKKELKNLFPEIKSKDAIFSYPKPTELIKHILTIATKNDDIILDSFAGSGTTAQAVMELNINDKCNRKYILIQISEEIKEKTSNGVNPAFTAGYRWVHEITRERVKRVIKKEQLKTGFSYFKLGSPIDAENILSGNLPSYTEFAKYVFYLATGHALEAENKIKEKDYFVGSLNDESIYLLYDNDIEKLKTLAITLDWAKKTHEKDSGRKIVYAPACYLDEEYLAQFNILFVGIPYNLFERA